MIFYSVDFRNLVDLIGHDGKVTSITWSKDDQFLGKLIEMFQLFSYSQNFEITNFFQSLVLKMAPSINGM